LIIVENLDRISLPSGQPTGLEDAWLLSTYSRLGIDALPSSVETLICLVAEIGLPGIVRLWNTLVFLSILLSFGPVFSSTDGI